MSLYYVNGGSVYNTDRVSDEFLTVNVCGFHSTDKQDFTTLREYGRRDYQIIYLLSGKLTYDLPNGEIREGHEGTVLIYRPRERQKYTYSAMEQSQGYWIHFSGTGVEALLASAGLSGRSDCDIGPTQECEQIFKDIIYELQIKNPGYNLVCCARLTELIALVGRRLSVLRNARVNAKYERLSTVIARMNAEYAQNVPIAEYAAMCAVTETHFIHLFREFTGLSPHAYVTRIRMDRARDLLSGSTLSVGEVARAVGYDNPLYFSRLFCAQTGYNPTNYRKISAYL